MTAENLAEGRAGFGSPVGVQDQRPTEAVYADLMMIFAQKYEIAQPSLAAFRPLNYMMHLTCPWRPTAAARPGAVPVTENHCPPQVIWDALDLADVQGEGLARVWDAELAGPQPGGKSVGP